ncbi:chaplin [Streptomyces sp. AS58]|uniref:Chaplin n=1 Tax=Streptomyces cadmiisoli TaxID=2184053 RepID=A0A2Z4J2U5_9ACTN|nr:MULTISPECIES: chaplin [Streptomyces]AWW39515.1 chaplin [Streptomyces cadmiisoli]KOV51880.1 chaplin [Streptomyces sp. AS58]
MSRIAKVGVVALGTGVVALGGAGVAAANSVAEGAAAGSPGFVSGNSIQAPVHVPLNVCGNTVTAIGGLNSALANACENRG